ncbi:hypothetical protein E2C01_062615 [Portunus trituberculatus]|uniref:Uncharacterized protein n=1 Tax=Portunus trituberculatus TaxID=210409 RepID=A0A5B7HFS0_PORTR|nr:hypothetical protein [Portunus trituberculatus]
MAASCLPEPGMPKSLFLSNLSTFPLPCRALLLPAPCQDTGRDADEGRDTLRTPFTSKHGGKGRRRRGETCAPLGLLTTLNQTYSTGIVFGLLL